MSWLSLKFNLKHCANISNTMFGCVTTKIRNSSQALRCLNKISWNKDLPYHHDTYCSCKFLGNTSFLLSLSFQAITHTLNIFFLKWMFYVLTQAHISYFSFYQCSTLFTKLFFLQSFTCIQLTSSVLHCKNLSSMWIPRPYNFKIKFWELKSIAGRLFWNCKISLK